MGGLANCDGNPANGCEATLDTTAYCGACGRACPANGTCTAGVCACPLGTTICGSTCASLGNDFFGCGSLGSTEVVGACDGLNRFSQDQCTSLGAPWQCPSMGGESPTVVKNGNAGGGVLCCRD